MKITSAQLAALFAGIAAVISAIGVAVMQSQCPAL